MPLKFFNPVASALLGFHQGQERRARSLIGQSMESPSDSRHLLAQAAQIDPKLVADYQNRQALSSLYAGRQAEAEHKAQQQQKMQHLKAIQARSAAMLAAINNAHDTGDWSHVQQVHEANMPFLAEQAKAMNAPAPNPEFDPNNGIQPVVNAYVRSSEALGQTPDAALLGQKAPVKPKITIDRSQGVYYQQTPNGVVAHGIRDMSAPLISPVTGTLAGKTPVKVDFQNDGSLTGQRILAGLSPKLTGPQRSQLQSLVSASEPFVGPAKKGSSSGSSNTHYDPSEAEIDSTARLVAVAEITGKKVTQVAGYSGKLSEAARAKGSAIVKKWLKTAGLKVTDIPALQASAKARTGALEAVQKKQSNLAGFANDLDLQILKLELAASYFPRNKLPAINWANIKKKKWSGDTNVAAYEQAVNDVQLAYGRVLGGGTGAAAATDSAMETSRKQFSSAQNAGQMQANIDQILAASNNTVKGFRQESGALMKSLRVINLGKPESRGIGGTNAEPKPLGAKQSKGLEAPTKSSKASAKGDALLDSILNGEKYGH